jgi:hypothetical protein
LLSSFLSILSFGSFESTLSLLLKYGGFNYELREILYVFAYIGLVLTVAQGVLVRRLLTRFSEAVLASWGAVVEIIGFLLLAGVTVRPALGLLMVATAVVVTGFALMTPSLNSLISRRSDPARQGSILGVNQSIGSLARILGPVISMPLFHISPTVPYWVAIALMVVAFATVRLAGAKGSDYESAPPSSRS